MSRLPLDFPGLQAEAQRLTEELLDVPGVDTDSLRAVSATLCRAFARLLADLTRPESQCFWLRALATRYGLPLPIVGAPVWRFEPTQAMWVLSIGDGPPMCFLGYQRAASNAVYVPGLTGMADPIEAFRLALCAAFAGCEIHTFWLQRHRARTNYLDEVGAEASKGVRIG